MGQSKFDFDAVVALRKSAETMAQVLAELPEEHVWTAAEVNELSFLDRAARRLAKEANACVVCADRMSKEED